jgi:hypothetical protein
MPYGMLAQHGGNVATVGTAAYATTDALHLPPLNIPVSMQHCVIGTEAAFCY